MFGLFKEKKTVVQEVAVPQDTTFEKITITSQNIAKDLTELATKHKISVKKLDFKILSFKTFCKVSYGDVFIEVTELNREKILTQENYLNPEMALYQEFKLEIFQKDASAKFPINIGIGGNKSLTKIQAKIKPQDNLDYFEGLEGEIFAEIDRKKAKLGFLVGCMDADVKAGVNKIVSAIRVNKAITEEIIFDICRGLDMIQAGGEEVIYHYKQNRDGELDERSSMQGVKKGDIVVEVRKKREGRKGRNCKGELLDEKMVELSLEIKPISVGEDFKIVEKDDSILYLANVDGYVYEDKEHQFSIKDEFIINAVSLKSTGDINVGQDKNIKITVQENNSSSDAIGAGVKIDTSEIKVAGNVANSAEILATKVEVLGQTHQTSKIEAQEVKIHLHKGYAEGSEVEVDIVEGGKIVGDIVRVKQLFGGEIEAKEVYIEKVISNSIVSASHHIEIGEIEGMGNKFVIDARVQRGYHERNEKLLHDIAENDAVLTKLTKEVKRYRNKIKQEEENVKGINKAVKELKLSGVKPPSALILKLKEYQESVKKHNSLLNELKDVKILQTSLSEELGELNASVYDAVVINKSPWKEFNEVKYKLLNPPIEVTFLAKEGDMMETLTLKADKDGEFQVKRQG